jgi:hypothetical protein
MGFRKTHPFVRLIFFQLDVIFEKKVIQATLNVKRHSKTW